MLPIHPHRPILLHLIILILYGEGEELSALSLRSNHFPQRPVLLTIWKTNFISIQTGKRYIYNCVYFNFYILRYLGDGNKNFYICKVPTRQEQKFSELNKGSHSLTEICSYFYRERNFDLICSPLSVLLILPHALLLYYLSLCPAYAVLRASDLLIFMLDASS